ncbi:MAG: hypothetical protein P8H31_07925 [Porticoccaceae bacterium]|nr:hypothetical protein [Porticoccaceae bacterium]
MNKLITGFLIIIASALISLQQATAETITLPLGEQTKQSAMELPKRSMNKQDVQRDFGDPQEITDAVGEPPISQWVYGDYIVYFENDWVLYSVVKHPSDKDKKPND